MKKVYSYIPVAVVSLVGWIFISYVIEGDFDPLSTFLFAVAFTVTWVVLDYFNFFDGFR